MALQDFLIFAGVGGLLMLLLRKFPTTRYLTEKSRFFEELIGCNLCLGFWTYSALSLLTGKNAIDFTDIPIVSNIITGCIASFLVFVFAEGWKSLYTRVEIVVKSHLESD